MKKPLLIVAILLTFSTTSFAAFSDTNPNTEFIDAILYSQEQGIVNGYPDGTFKPSIQINRAEFTKIIMNAAFEEEEISGENCFPDVQNEWFAKYICKAKDEGIINGYPDETFKPDADISFVEAAKIISLGFKYETTDDDKVWYSPFLKTLSNKRAIPISITKVDKKITRGEMVEMIYRLKENVITETSMSYNNDALTSWYIPTPETSWHWQLAGTIDTSHEVEMYDVDLVETPQETINELHTKNIKVICYFSAGSWEEFRDDAADFPEEVIGKTLDGWPDEKWLDVSNYKKFADIMTARLDLAVQKNCDGVEPDNVQTYQEDSGFEISYDQQLIYNKWLAAEAHSRSLSIALKNDLSQIDDLLEHFDFAINEECFNYDECEALTTFIDNGKAVLGVEYELETEDFCEEAKALKFSWLKMDYELDGSRESC